MLSASAEVNGRPARLAHSSSEATSQQNDSSGRVDGILCGVSKTYSVCVGDSGLAESLETIARSASWKVGHR